MSHVAVGIIDGHHRGKIDAIKALRASFFVTDDLTGDMVSGLSLVDAKRYVELMMDDRQLVVLHNLSEDVLRQLQQNGFYLDGPEVKKYHAKKGITVFRKENRNKIELVKDLRHCLSLGLKDAVDMATKIIEYGERINISNPTDHQVYLLKKLGFDVRGLEIEHFENQDDLFTI